MSERRQSGKYKSLSKYRDLLLYNVPCPGEFHIYSERCLPYDVATPFESFYYVRKLLQQWLFIWLFQRTLALVFSPPRCLIYLPSLPHPHLILLLYFPTYPCITPHSNSHSLRDSLFLPSLSPAT